MPNASISIRTARTIFALSPYRTGREARWPWRSAITGGAGARVVLKDRRTTTHAQQSSDLTIGPQYQERKRRTRREATACGSILSPRFKRTTSATSGILGTDCIRPVSLGSSSLTPEQ